MEGNFPDASFWDLDACVNKQEDLIIDNAAFDVAIVGGGILGCSVARVLRNEAPHLRCVVIERGQRPLGASTRNAGFACFGSVGEIIEDINSMGAVAAKQLVERRIDGLRRLRNHVADQDIGFQLAGGNEIFLNDDPSLERINEVNQLLAPLFPTSPFELRDDLIATYGLSAKVKHLIHTPYEGMLHSGKLLNNLQHENVITGTVTAIDVNNSDYHTLKVTSTAASPYGNADLSIHAKKVVIATNAWLSELVPTLEVVPARGQVLVTKPIDGLALHGTFHMNAGYVYFRNVGQRVLLGGGRNLAFETERTTHMITTETIQQYLDELLSTIIVPERSAEVDMRWAGVMAFTKNKQPMVVEVDAGVVAAVTCNGMGVALASRTAADVAAVVLHNVSST